MSIKMKAVKTDIRKLAKKLINEAMGLPDGMIAQLVERDGEYKIYSIESGHWMSKDKLICTLTARDGDVSEETLQGVISMINEGISYNNIQLMRGKYGYVHKL